GGSRTRALPRTTRRSRSAPRSLGWSTTGSREPRPRRRRRRCPADAHALRLFENDDVLALDKPPGGSMATSTREEKSAVAAVARLLEACGEPPDATFRLVHRLDLGTSGVVLLAKTAESHLALTRAFQSGGARKTYSALVWGHPVPASGEMDRPLGRDPKDGRKMKVRAAGKRARTRYQTPPR